MKTTSIKTETDHHSSSSLFRACVNACGKIRDGIQSVKNRVTLQFRDSLKGQERPLALALNEAEALAWQTDFPHLFFPELALEKAQTAVAWQRRQNSILKNHTAALAA